MASEGTAIEIGGSARGGGDDASAPAGVIGPPISTSPAPSGIGGPVSGIGGPAPGIGGPAPGGGAGGGGVEDLGAAARDIAQGRFGRRDSENAFEIAYATSWRRPVHELAAAKGDEKSSGLGTLGGNILGVILFLRVPWIAAQAGAVQATLVVICCVACTLPTALSISAIATNGRIPAGGPYYVVSRNLGPEVGGAIGIVFYLGTTVAATMYVLGAVEAFQTGFGFTDLFEMDTEILALGVMFLLSCIVHGGVKLVAKVAPVFLFVVLVSIGCAVLGVSMFGAGEDFGGTDELVRADEPSIGPDYVPDVPGDPTPSFTSLIALFFPSVTGIMAGSNRSGVLSDPGKSIPTGTLSAISVTTLLYVLFIWLFALFVDNQTLKDNKLVVSTVAWPHPIVVALGIVMSSVGAALQSLTGAPQLLAGIIDDGIVPFLDFLKPASTVEATAEAAADGDGTVEDETHAARMPTRELWLTWFLASLPCLAGNLDAITPPQTIFFLSMYAAINLACFVLSVLKAPSFRPSFRAFHWSTALFGVLACAAVMCVVSWPATLFAVVLVTALYKYIAKVRQDKQWGDWGDTGTALRLEQAHTALLALGTGQHHPKNWRPQVLVLARTSRTGHPVHPRLLHLAAQLKEGRGLTIVATVFQGNLADKTQATEAAEAEQILAQNVKSSGVRGFTSVLVSDTIVGGVLSTVQTAGLGALKPNTVLLTWPSSRDPPKVQAYVDLLKALRRLQKSLVVAKGIDDFPSNDARMDTTIDVWWLVHDGGLLLLMPYMLRLCRVWSHCKLRLFAIVAKGQSNTRAKQKLQKYLASLRIPAEVEMVSMDKDVVTDAMQDRTLDIKARYALLEKVKASSITKVVTADREEALVQAGLRRPMEPTVLGNPRQPKKRATLAQIFSGIDGNSVAAAAADTDRKGDGSAGIGGAAATGVAAEVSAPKSTGGAGNGSAVGGVAAEDGEGEADDEVKVSDVMPRLRSASAIVDDENVDALAMEVDESQMEETSQQRRSVAQRLNAKIKEMSPLASLIVTNLPLTRKVKAMDFMTFVDEIVADLPRVLLIRGSGKEIVTSFA